jgi:hypothetical protein
MGETMQIVVTDLTRFSNKNLLCMAGVTEDGQTCIRPLRSSLPGYLSYDECKKISLLPGTILEGVFKPVAPAVAPHTEDNIFSNMKIAGVCTSEQFESVLRHSSFRSLTAGFGVPINDKVLTQAPARSIITLAIRPEQLTITTGYNGDGVKANIVDETGLRLRFLSITDLGFFDYVGNPDTRRRTIDEMNDFIASQDRLYLRVGLGRKYKSQDNREGYWLQVNGIYTFPDYQEIIRRY